VKERQEIEEDKTRKRKKERIDKADIKHRNEKERELDKKRQKDMHTNVHTYSKK